MDPWTALFSTMPNGFLGMPFLRALLMLGQQQQQPPPQQQPTLEQAPAAPSGGGADSQMTTGSMPLSPGTPGSVVGYAPGAFGSFMSLMGNAPGMAGSIAGKLGTLLTSEHSPLSGPFTGMMQSVAPLSIMTAQGWVPAVETRDTSLGAKALSLLTGINLADYTPSEHGNQMAALGNDLAGYGAQRAGEWGHEGYTPGLTSPLGGSSLGVWNPDIYAGPRGMNQAMATLAAMSPSIASNPALAALALQGMNMSLSSIAPDANLAIALANNAALFGQTPDNDYSGNVPSGPGASGNPGDTSGGIGSAGEGF